MCGRPPNNHLEFQKNLDAPVPGRKGCRRSGIKPRKFSPALSGLFFWQRRSWPAACFSVSDPDTVSLAAAQTVDDYTPGLLADSRRTTPRMVAPLHRNFGTGANEEVWRAGQGDPPVRACGCTWDMRGLPLPLPNTRLMNTFGEERRPKHFSPDLRAFRPAA